MTSATTAEQAPNAGEAAEAIPVLRSQIDAMDEAILRLVAERAKLSRRIQLARMNAGGTRVELGRERLILDTYRRALGPAGASLADAILRVRDGIGPDRAYLKRLGLADRFGVWLMLKDEHRKRN